MKFHEPLFELQSLTALQGYSLQVFASGRMKLTLSDAGTRRECRSNITARYSHPSRVQM